MNDLQLEKKTSEKEHGLIRWAPVWTWIGSAIIGVLAWTTVYGLIQRGIDAQNAKLAALETRIKEAQIKELERVSGDFTIHAAQTYMGNGNYLIELKSRFQSDTQRKLEILGICVAFRAATNPNIRDTAVPWLSMALARANVDEGHNDPSDLTLADAEFRLHGCCVSADCATRGRTGNIQGKGNFAFIDGPAIHIPGDGIGLFHFRGVIIVNAEDDRSKREVYTDGGMIVLKP